jgi:transmembrane sensor
MTPDDALLARYLARECTPAEAAAVRQWIAEDPEHAHAVERLRAAFDTAPPPRPEPDLDAMWAHAVRPRTTVRRRPSRPSWTLIAAAVLLIAALLVNRSAKHGPVREVATSIGQRATIDLGDGSRVVLGPRSRLRMQERDVTLDGQAYFEVRHDAAHPFRVHIAGGVAEDLGTRFVIRSYAGEPVVQVVVADGSVAVSRAGSVPIALHAGQLARIDTLGTAEVRRVDTAAYVAFASGRLVFDGAPLGEVVRELGRWYDLDIQLDAPASAGRHITASFTGLAEDDVLGAVAAAAGLRYTRHGRTVTFSRARGTP